MLEPLASQKPVHKLHNEYVFISENGEHTLYVAACNPISLYFMTMTGENGFFVDFFDIFPRMASGSWRPFVTVAPLGSLLRGQVVLHEEQVRHTRHSWD